ncbi:Protein of unknown function [Pseudomonas sp. NFACC19-2]|nr:Protein of unknown function [Pseudomonas sp. NFACC19-2]
MANIGTFTAEKVGFSGQLCTLILNVKVRLVSNDDQKGDRFIYWSTVRYWPKAADHHVPLTALHRSRSVSVPKSATSELM